MVNVTDKLAVVSGGARDIGRAISLQLAKCGASVAFCYRDSTEQAKETLECLSQIGVKALAVQADLTQRSDTEAFIAKVQSTQQMLDQNITIRNVRPKKDRRNGRGVLGPGH